MCIFQSTLSPCAHQNFIFNKRLPKYALVSSPLSVKSLTVASTAGECQEEGSEKNSWQEELGAGGDCLLPPWRGAGAWHRLRAGTETERTEVAHRRCREPTDWGIGWQGQPILKLASLCGKRKNDDKDPNSGEISFHTRKVTWPGIAMNSKIHIKSNQSMHRVQSKLTIKTPCSIPPNPHPPHPQSSNCPLFSSSSTSYLCIS